MSLGFIAKGGIYISLCSSFILGAVQKEQLVTSMNMNVFKKAINGIEQRLELWKRCARGDCSFQEKIKAKKDLKRGLAMVGAGTAMLVGIITPLVLYKMTKKKGVSLLGYEESISSQDIEAAAKIANAIKDQRPLEEIKAMIGKNPKVANAPIGQGLPHLYIIAAEQGRKDIIDALAQKGAQMLQPQTSKQGAYNVVTAAVKERHFDIAKDLLDEYTFDWEALPDEYFDEFLAMLAINDSNTTAQAILQKVKEVMGSVVFDEKLRNWFEKKTDPQCEKVKKDAVARWGYSFKE